MTIALDRDQVSAGLYRVTIQQIPGLIELHLTEVAGTRNLEAMGLQLRKGGLTSRRLAKFIREVCAWGGYAGIAGRVLKDNSSRKIRSEFKRTGVALEGNADLPDRNVQALRALNRLRGLGKPSFASKHLRFLYPELCPVLDSLVAKEFCYPVSLAGYHAYSADCMRVAKGLSDLRIENPMGRLGGQWFAADVDMALYALIAPWSPYARISSSGCQGHESVSARVHFEIP